MDQAGQLHRAATSGGFELGPLVAAMATAIRRVVSAQELWEIALRELSSALGADAALGFESTSEDRLLTVASHHWPGALHPESLPIAPDSQSAYVLAHEGAVVCCRFADEDRFVPADLLVHRGFASSLSCRLDGPAGTAGLIGFYSRTAHAFDTIALPDFEALVSTIATGLHQLRRLDVAEQRATHDYLTELLSRSAILDLLGLRLAAAEPTSVMMIDLDGFKPINDQYGHQVGDRLLRQISARLMASAGGASVGRLGGDEFLIVVPSDAEVDLQMLAEKIAGSCETIISVDRVEIEVSASIGIAVALDAEPPTSLLRRVDRAMYEAKAQGRGLVRAAQTPVKPSSRRAHLTDRADRIDRRAPSSIDIDEAIARLRVHFQPIVDASGSTIGVEALARGPEGTKLERPDVFFQTASTHGRLGEAELRAKTLAFEAGVPTDVRLFINLEPAAFRDPHWLGLLADAWREAGEHPLVTAELTERSLLESPGQLLRAVERCRELGWSIALDDIGARADSLAALRLVKPDVVKLDIGLIRNRDRSHATRIATAVAGYCDRHDADVVGEGIETLDQMAVAHVLGANLFQGYHFARPAALDQLVLGDAGRPLESTRGPRVTTKSNLLAVSRHLEAEASSSDCVLLATVQEARFYTQRTRRQYEALARRCGFVGVLAKGITTSIQQGVRLACLADDDPLAPCWYVVLVSNNASLALIAEELPSPNPSVSDADRPFRYQIVTDPAHVERVALQLFERF